MPLVPLGPWPLGQDTVQDETSGVFQTPLEEQTPARLTKAVNVDLDDEGWPIRRSGVTQRSASGASGAVSLVSVAGNLYLQEGQVLSIVDTTDWTKTVLVADLGNQLPIHTTDYTNQLWWTNGDQCGCVSGSSAYNWGLPLPELAVTTASGSGLAAGIYLLQASFSDSRLNEGGTAAITAVTVTAANPRIAIDLAPLSTTGNATHLNLYVGQEDQPIPTFHSSVALSALPAVITAVTGAGDPAPANELQGPPSGIVGCVGFRAFMLVWRDNILFRSEAHEPHLFDPNSIMSFVHDIRAVQGVEGGIWVGTTGGLFWLSAGDDPTDWRSFQRSTSAVSVGSLLLPGVLLPRLKTSFPVALFATEEGLAMGLSDGGLVVDDKYSFPANSRCEFCYADKGEFSQVLIAVTE